MRCMGLMLCVHWCSDGVVRVFSADCERVASSGVIVVSDAAVHVLHISHPTVCT